MTLSKEHIAHDQLLCSNCEEIVHISASSCPYCNASLQPKNTLSSISGSKITSLISSDSPVTAEKHPTSQPKTDSSSAVLSLLLLLGGCNVLFLGILIALFSKEGSFSLQWPEQHWPVYFGMGIALTSFGIFTLKQVEK